jgi:hypothetical protein
MSERKCDFCSAALTEADRKLNERRYAEYLRRYPDAGISDNFGDRPYFRVLCGVCTAKELQSEADRRKNESFMEALLQGESHPDFTKNFFIFCLVIIVLAVLLLGRG